jgi:predicted KAP-like P-loop ATPase
MDSSTTHGINLTYSVESALRKTDEKTTSWQIVQQLLQSHGEYGNQRGRQIATGKGPNGLVSNTKDAWIRQVLELFDQEMVKELHGRLLILGLAQLDPPLKEYLNRIGFLVPLRDELQEDFDSLLLPEYARDQAYKRTFLKMLNNKPSGGTKLRNRGFVAVIDGGPGLKEMAKLCQRQRWNTCYTARYVLNPSQPIYEPVSKLAEDILNLTSGTAIGDFVPDPLSEASGWEEDIKPWIEPKMEKFGIIGIGERNQDGFLKTGKRLVLLIEYRRVPDNATPESIEFYELLGVIESIPERVCLVISGLPPALTSLLEKFQSASDPGAPVILLTIPNDLELTRSQPLANDIPAGPDQLNLMGEVNAIAEAMTLKDLNPPLVVGILGGWGSGKSFVLHLIRNRIQEIRCEPVNSPEDASFPFIGHPYIINFDAWTYAKSNLWASLMQKIFMELDRQIGLEQLLITELGKDLKEGQNTQIWRVLNDLSDDERERILKTDLGKQALDIAEQFKKGDLPETRLWDILEQLKIKEIHKLEEVEKNLQVASAACDDLEFQLKQKIDQEIEKDAQNSTIKNIGDKFLKDTWEAWMKKNGQEQPPTFSQLINSVSWFSMFKKESAAYLWSLIIFAGLGILITFLTKTDWYKNLEIPAILGVVGSLITGFYKFQQWASKTKIEFDAITKSKRRDSEQVYKNIVRLSDRMNHGSAVNESASDADTFIKKMLRDENIREGGQALAAQERKLLEYQNEVATIRQRVGMAARHRNLLDFVQHRLEGKIYEDKLGLLHQVKDDLEELSDALMHDDRENPLFTRGKPRIILLIDDLDRCPPPKVVEVLEAAQLLVKTSLFVVVIAMDVRYVTRALEHEYVGVLTPFGEPTGLDYIEKIIQIPYRVRPASGSSVKSFLWAQMSPHKDGDDKNKKQLNVNGGPAVREKKTTTQVKLEKGEEGRSPESTSSKTELRILPTETIYFSEEEYHIITECCSVYNVSPRTMKRLVNVFKLLKIIWYRDKLGNGPAEDVKKTMLAMLVLAAKYPEPMRELLHMMERQYVQSKAIADDNVVKFLAGKCRERAKVSLVPQMWKEVEEALSNDKLVAQKLTFAELHEQHLHLVSSFSFVGESDPLRQVEMQKNSTAIKKEISSTKISS